MVPGNSTPAVPVPEPRASLRMSITTSVGSPEGRVIVCGYLVEGEMTVGQHAFLHSGRQSVEVEISEMFVESSEVKTAGPGADIAVTLTLSKSISTDDAMSLTGKSDIQYGSRGFFQPDADTFDEAFLGAAKKGGLSILIEGTAVAGELQAVNTTPENIQEIGVLMARPTYLAHPLKVQLRVQDGYSVNATLSEILEDSGPAADWNGELDQAGRENFDFRLGPAKRIDDTETTVHFATDRKKLTEKGLTFGRSAGSGMTLGRCRVSIPASHKLGRVEDPMGVDILGHTIALPRRRGEHMCVVGCEEISADKFVDSAQGRDVLVFVHGYGNDFEDSTLRLGQIVHDLNFSGFAVVFSWPATGRQYDYLIDRETARRSVSRLMELLVSLDRSETNNRLTLVSHSLGADLALEALERLVQQGKRLPNEILMAAPDVEEQLFRQRVGTLASAHARPGITLYASSTDLALIASRRLNGSRRAGELDQHGSPLIVSSVDSIDVSAVGIAFFGTDHASYAKSRPLLEDMGRLLNGDRPPGKRSPTLRAMPDAETTQYWRFPQA